MCIPTCFAPYMFSIRWFMLYNFCYKFQSYDFFYMFSIIQILPYDICWTYYYVKLHAFSRKIGIDKHVEWKTNSQFLLKIHGKEYKPMFMNITIWQINLLIVTNLFIIHSWTISIQTNHEWSWIEQITNQTIFKLSK